MDIAAVVSQVEFPNRSASSEPLPDEKVAPSTRLIERLFARFAAVYGAKFANAWAGADPEEMKRAWSERLSRFDVRQVGRALELCETSVKFPPTLPEFIEIVRSCHQPSGLAIEYKPTSPAACKSEAENTASREYPKPPNGFGVFWACQIVRLGQLGAYDKGQLGYVRAMEVLGLKSDDELAIKYPPTNGNSETENERESIQSESGA